MNDNLFNPVRELTEPSQKSTTTLMVDNVPSEIAYNILMSSIQSGGTLSSEELRKLVDDRMKAGNIKIIYSELAKFFGRDKYNIDKFNSEENRIDPEAETEKKLANIRGYN